MKTHIKAAYHLRNFETFRHRQRLGCNYTSRAPAAWLKSQQKTGLVERVMEQW